MSFYIIGDLHGGAVGDGKKLNNKEVWKACGDKYPDFVIVCGDFGYIFAPESNKKALRQELYNLLWLEEKPFKILFCDGNHECFDRLNKLPSEFMFGSDVGVVNKNVFHLRRGRVYHIDNKSFFVMGGASSIDKEDRILGISYWADEVPDYNDFNRANKNLDMYEGKVDYVLSHACPVAVKSLIHTYKWLYPDPTEDLLSALDERLTYKKWFFGHYHLDKEVSIGSKNYQCLYKRGYYVE